MYRKMCNKFRGFLDVLLGKIFINLRLLNYFVASFFLRLKVNGVENFDGLKPGGVLFIANHHSYFDPFLIGSFMPKQYLKKIKRLRFMTESRYIDDKWYGFLIKFLGAYPVYKTGGDYKKSLKETIELLNNSQDVLIFPSGKRDKDFDPSTAKPGVAYLANNYDLQIVPIYISDTYKITTKDFFYRKRKVVITFGKKINYINIKDENKDLRLEAVEIAKNILSLNEKI